MSTATTTYTPTPPPQIAADSSHPNSLVTKTQQAINEATAALVEKLKAGNSAALTQYLQVIAKFHKYSFGNVMMIARQRPDASRVAGFNAWKDFNRFVRKGEKGIAIHAPIVVNKDRNGAALEHGPRMIGCRIVYVFDVSQTDGEPLAEISTTVNGDPGPYTARLIRFCESQGIQVDARDEESDGAMGYSEGGKITIFRDAMPARFFATLVHETAHELLHKGERKGQLTKKQRETEAEATAYIVSQAIGLDCGDSSADYIGLYNGDAATLAESLRFIQDAARQITAAIDAEPADQEGE